MNYCYARVSTAEQHLDRQVSAFEPYAPYELFQDKESGKDFDRTEYKKMKRKLKSGDTLIVLSLDRFGRNYDQIKIEWQELSQKGVKIKIIDMPIIDTTTNDLTSKLISDIVIQLLSYVAQTERENILKRQAQGIQAAKERGVKFGRPRAKMPENFDEVVQRYVDNEITNLEATELLGISRGTFFKILKSRGYSKNEKNNRNSKNFEKSVEEFKSGKITVEEIMKEYNYKSKWGLIDKLKRYGCDVKQVSEVREERIKNKLKELISKIEQRKINMAQVSKYCGASAYTITKILEQMGIENSKCIKCKYKAILNNQLYCFKSMKEAEEKLGFSSKTIYKHIKGAKNYIDKLGIKVMKA